MGNPSKSPALRKPQRRAPVALDEVIESFHPLLERMKAGSRAAEGPCDDQLVSRSRAGAAGDAFASAQSGHRDRCALRGHRVTARDRNTRLVDALVERSNRLDFGVGGKTEPDKQPDGVGTHRRQIAQVDGRRLVTEVAPGRPLEAKMDPFDEEVLTRNEPGIEKRSLRVETRNQPAQLELPQEPELTEL
jgi:hypothetical protein